MSNDTSEQRKHPASRTKIRQLRKKGQLAIAGDFRSILVFVVGILVFVAAIPWLRTGFVSTFGSMFDAKQLTRTPEALMLDAIRAPHILGVFAFMVAMLLAALVFASIDMKGILVSNRVFTEGFSRLNPVTNVKERFSVRALLEAMRGISLTVAFIVGAGFVITRFVGDLFNAPYCGGPCVIVVTETIFARMLLLVVVLMLVASVLDYVVSHFLFLKQNRMTDAEVKRENKDNYGSPELKQRQREFRRDLLESASSRPSNASVAIYGGSKIYLLGYQKTQDGPPVVADIQAPENLQSRLSELRGAGTVLIHNDAAVAALENARRGEEIPEEAFKPVASALQTAGIV